MGSERVNVAIETARGEQLGIRIEGVKVQPGKLEDLKNNLTVFFGEIMSMRILNDAQFEREYERVCTLEDIIDADNVETA